MLSNHKKNTRADLGGEETELAAYVVRYFDIGHASAQLSLVSPPAPGRLL